MVRGRGKVVLEDIGPRGDVAREEAAEKKRQLALKQERDEALRCWKPKNRRDEMLRGINGLLLNLFMEEEEEFYMNEMVDWMIAEGEKKQEKEWKRMMDDEFDHHSFDEQSDDEYCQYHQDYQQNKFESDKTAWIDRQKKLALESFESQQYLDELKVLVQEGGGV